MSKFVVYLTDVAKYSYMSARKSCDLHKVIHCALLASVVLKQKRFEPELLIQLQCLLTL